MYIWWFEAEKYVNFICPKKRMENVWNHQPNIIITIILIIIIIIVTIVITICDSFLHKVSLPAVADQGTHRPFVSRI